MRLVLREIVGEELDPIDPGQDFVDRLNDEAGEDLYTVGDLRDCFFGIQPLAPHFFHHLSDAFLLTPTEMNRVMDAWLALSYPAVGRSHEKVSATPWCFSSPLAVTLPLVTAALPHILLPASLAAGLVISLSWF